MERALERWRQVGVKYRLDSVRALNIQPTYTDSQMCQWPAHTIIFGGVVIVETRVKGVVWPPAFFAPGGDE